jgi:S-adenosylmethionine/arginine decarboxylase-like enzyme
MAFGKHLILDLGRCCKIAVRNPDTIRAFAKELVERIDMVAYGEPQVVHFGKGPLSGYTLVQLIETSNISGHFCDESGDAYIDVFSCKTFHPKDVTDVVDKYFSPKTSRQGVFNRQAPELI